MAFAEAHFSWTVEDWKRVIISDKTNGNRSGSDGAVWTWIAPDGVEPDHNVKHLYKHGGGSIMIWGCFSYKGVGFMTQIQGRMNAELSCKILEDEFKNTLEWYDFDSSQIYFQQDNDPKHTSKLLADNAMEVT